MNIQHAIPEAKAREVYRLFRAGKDSVQIGNILGLPEAYVVEAIHQARLLGQFRDAVANW